MTKNQETQDVEVQEQTNSSASSQNDSPIADAKKEESEVSKKKPMSKEEKKKYSEESKSKGIRLRTVFIEEKKEICNTLKNELQNLPEDQKVVLEDVCERFVISTSKAKEIIFFISQEINKFIPVDVTASTKIAESKGASVNSLGTINLGKKMIEAVCQENNLENIYTAQGTEYEINLHEEGIFLKFVK